MKEVELGCRFNAISIDFSTEIICQHRMALEPLCEQCMAAETPT